MLPTVNESSEQESDPLLQPLFLYLSGPAFLVSSTDPYKELFAVKSVFKSFDHVSIV